MSKAMMDVQVIKTAISNLAAENSEINFVMVLEAVREYMNAKGVLLTPVVPAKRKGGEEKFCELTLSDGQRAIVAFTDEDNAAKGPEAPTMLHDTEELLRCAMAMQEIDGILLNPWSEPFFLERDLIQAIFDQNYRNSSHVNFKLGNIFELEVPAIVSSANQMLSGEGGMAAGLMAAAGPELASALLHVKVDVLKITGAVVTSGFHIAADKVIHAAVPTWNPEDPEGSRDLLRQTYVNILDVASMMDIHTLGCPALATGSGAFPVEEAIPIAMMTVTDWFAAHENYPMNVVFCCNKVPIYEVFQEYIEYVKRLDAEVQAFGRIVSE